MTSCCILPCVLAAIEGHAIFFPEDLKVITKGGIKLCLAWKLDSGSGQNPQIAWRIDYSGGIWQVKQNSFWIIWINLIWLIFWIFGPWTWLIYKSICFSYLWLQVLRQWQLCPQCFEQNKNTPPCPLLSRCGSPANHSYEQKPFLLPLHWHCQLCSCAIINQLGHFQKTAPTVCIIVLAHNSLSKISEKKKSSLHLKACKPQ